MAFFVEDNAQKIALELIAKKLDVELTLHTVGSCTIVDSLCRLMNAKGVENVFFLRDGDNQNTNEELKTAENYIHLKKYCIQNYFLDASILSKINTLNLNVPEVKKIIKDCIKEYKDKKNNNIAYIKLAELDLDFPEEVLDTYNAANIMKTMPSKLGLKNYTELFEKFIDQAQADSKLKDIFEEITSNLESAC